MHIYLGEDPDSSEALDFLGLAEGGEIIHYEALNEMIKGIKNAQATDIAQSILEEEKNHLMKCIQLARQNARYFLLIALISALHFFLPLSIYNY